MGEPQGRIARILVLHPEAAIRRALEQAIRRGCSDPVTVYEAESLSEGMRRVRQIEPHAILLDLSEERALALRMASELRAPERRIIGLYSPLLVRDREDDFFPAAARAGIGDFVPLPAAEDQLAAALEGLLVDAGRGVARREGRVMTFISCKGGVGTTTLAINVGSALAAGGGVAGGVALCDCQVQFGTAAAYLGMAPESDLADLVAHLDDPGALSAYLEVARESELRVLASPRQVEDGARIEPEDLSRVLIGLRRAFGVVIADCPPVLDLLTLAVLDLSERIVVVTEAVTPAVLSTARFLELLERQGFADRLRLALNRHSTAEGVLERDIVERELGRRVDAVLPEDRALVAAASDGAAYVLARPEAPFSRALSRLAAELGEAEGASVATETLA